MLEIRNDAGVCNVTLGGAGLCRCTGVSRSGVAPGVARQTHAYIKLHYEVLPRVLSEIMVTYAAFLVEQDYLAGGLRLADVLIAATALVDLGETLLTANDKHYRIIEQLALEVFRA